MYLEPLQALGLACSLLSTSLEWIWGEICLDIVGFTIRTAFVDGPGLEQGAFGEPVTRRWSWDRRSMLKGLFNRLQGILAFSLPKVKCALNCAYSSMENWRQKYSLPWLTSLIVVHWHPGSDWDSIKQLQHIYGSWTHPPLPHQTYISANHLWWILGTR